MTKKSMVISVSSRPKISFKKAVLHFFWLLLVSVWMPFPSTAMAAEPDGGTKKPLPLWWTDTQKRADSAGYKLITPENLERLIKSGEPFVLLDVRPDYEYSEDHIPGALNLEFHLGHRSRIEPAHATAMRKLLGEDPDKKIVIYCRSFR